MGLLSIIGKVLDLILWILQQRQPPSPGDKAREQAKAIQKERDALRIAIKEKNYEKVRDSVDRTILELDLLRRKSDSSDSGK